MPLWGRKQKRSTVLSFVKDEDGFGVPGYRSLDRDEDVLKCVHIIADLVSNMTIMLMQNGDNGDTRIRDSLSRRIDIDPSSVMTRKTLIYNIARDMCLYGNKVCLVRTDENENTSYIREIVPIPHSQTSFIEKKLTSYKIRIGQQVYERDEVLHFVLNPCRQYEYLGRGFVDMVAETVSTLTQANTTKKGFMRSEWKPSMIVTINSDIEELQDPKFRSKVLGSYTETTKQGEPWLVPAGGIDVKTVSPLSLKDLAIQESIELDKKAVAAAFGVPAFLLGVGSYNKDEYNNFISRTVMSVAVAIQQELTRGTLYGNRYWKFKRRSLMDYSMSDLTSHVKEMTSNGMMSRNEGRDTFDMSPSDAPGMNDFNVLENYIPIDKIGDQKKLKGGE